MKGPPLPIERTITMDAIDTPTTDTVVTDEVALVEDPTNDSFGKEIAKTLVISAATTAGMIAGIGAIGFAVGKLQEFKAKRASKKNAEPEVHVVTDLPEKPETED